MKLSLFTIILVFLSLGEIKAQYGPILCGDKCSPEHHKDVIKGLQKKTKKDTTRCYLLYANYQFSYKNNLDSTIHYLNLVHNRDSTILSKFYAVDFLNQEFLARESIYFVNKIPINYRKKYLNEALIAEFTRETESDDSEELDDFIKSIEELDQFHRTRLTFLGSAIDKIIANEKNDNYKILKHEEDSLWILQEKNDSIAFAMILDKYANEPMYSDREFTSAERRMLFAFFLHSGNKLKDAIPLLNHLLKKDIIPLETYKMFIARGYCVRFKKSPVKSVHCEQDESLMIMVKEEFPNFYQLYIKDQN